MGRDKKDKQGSAGTSAPVPTGKPPPAPVNPFRVSNPPLSKSSVVLHHESSEHVGPIPPASDLAKYNQVVPGLAETIVRWADQEISHRHELEKAATMAEIAHLRASDGDSRLGLWLGFTVAITLVVVSAILAWHEKTWAAVGLSSGTLVSLVAVFVYGSQKKRIAKRKTHPPPNNHPAPTE